MRACVMCLQYLYDHNILPRPKMIIIKIVILYFIQIRHTDDFPSTGTRPVIIKCRHLYEGRQYVSSIADPAHIPSASLMF